MTIFNTAVEMVLRHEGGYVDHPDDPGGETNFGISKRAYPALDIKNLTRAEAKEIYRRDYWDAVKADALPPAVAVIVFDMAVNMGVGRAAKIMQTAAGAQADGAIGPNTLSAVRAKDAEFLAREMTTRRVLFYASLSTFATFGKGWVRRSLDVFQTALGAA